ncbi:hypothetical protein NUH16_006818 [Penicillium rubens]|nr:hypothetical protein NUH16_006818 [Penicillium rubens]
MDVFWAAPPVTSLDSGSIRFDVWRLIELLLGTILAELDILMAPADLSAGHPISTNWTETRFLL